MRSVTKLYLAAAAISAAAAMPAAAEKAAQKAGSHTTAEATFQMPPGIQKALERASPRVGHDNDVPRGKGKGWGHLLHNHEETPVSP